MNTINLYDWDLTYAQFRDWITETGSDVYAITSDSRFISDSKYMFNEEADYLAFTLKFKLRTKSMDTGVYYCPYLPLLKHGVFKIEIS